MSYGDDLWDVLEKYSETKLFKDWNDPKVNALLRGFESDLLEVHYKNCPPLYSVSRTVNDKLN